MEKERRDFLQWVCGMDQPNDGLQGQSQAQRIGYLSATGNVLVYIAAISHGNYNLDKEETVI